MYTGDMGQPLEKVPRGLCAFQASPADCIHHKVFFYEL